MPSRSTHLRTLLADILGTETEPTPIEPHAQLIDDLGADSLDAYELQIAIEEEFGVAIEDDELPRLITVGDLVKRIDNAQPPT
ncbi:acyl carrier protein [Azospirillum sp.]|uniref:acyl carrier protein n=1 Tax=Azospirillum sp. TaxID=34012 RepID=UPI002D65CD8D|nr:acyl carrier protein [Azospirillum sp.]HYF88774.1 acyl carrier protein [Azospirillum sp.]